VSGPPRALPADLKEQAARLQPWFHNLHLPDGSETAPDHPLGDFPRYKWQQLRAVLPEDMQGWSVLDIGCNAGFYSFELARCGAEVLAIDSDPHYLRQAQWAGEVYGLSRRVTLRRMQVYQVARLRRRFDLVLFMGVFYHLRHPLLALDIVAAKVSRRLIFQTMIMPGEQVEIPPQDFSLDERERLTRPGWPKMAFIERRLAGDPTNWWVPNHAAVEAMLRSCGLRVVQRPGEEIYVCEPEPGGEREVAGLPKKN
jgi:tRNA (mo5U34)-methyltransferase